MKPQKRQAEDLERKAERAAGLDCYVGHLSETEMERRINKYCKLLSRLEKTERGGH